MMIHYVIQFLAEDAISCYIAPEELQRRISPLERVCRVVRNGTRQAPAPEELRQRRGRDAHGLLTFMPEHDDALLAARPIFASSPAHPRAMTASMTRHARDTAFGSPSCRICSRLPPRSLEGPLMKPLFSMFPAWPSISSPAAQFHAFLQDAKASSAVRRLNLGSQV